MRTLPAYRWGRLLASSSLGILLVAFAVLTLGACSSSGDDTGGTATAGGGSTQTSEGGQVTIKATWRGRGAEPVFAIALDTHSVDLDGIELRALAALRVDGGEERTPASWDAPKGGHHREGTLTFAGTTAGGTPAIGPNSRSIELVIRDVAGVKERIFRWSV